VQNYALSYLKDPKFASFKKLNSQKMQNRREKSNMIKLERFVLIGILICYVFVSVAIPRGSAAISLSKPIVTLPSGWSLTNQTAYPNSKGAIHDPLGCGFVEYQNSVTGETVLIFYENSMGQTYTTDQLRTDAENIYTKDFTNNFTESGIMNVAGVLAGYAQVYNSFYDLNYRELVFIKGNYYFNILALYMNGDPSAMALVNSISTPPQQSPTQQYAIIAIVIVVVAGVLVSVMVIKKIKPGKRAFMQPAKGKLVASETAGRVATGYPILDNLLYGGLPEKFSVVLTSPSCDERDMLIKSFLETGARKGEITFCVTNTPSFGTDLTKQYPSNFYLFDCSPLAETTRDSPPNKFMLKGVENLTNISIAITKLLNALTAKDTGGRRICISLVSDAVLYNGVVETRRWLTELIPELKTNGFTILAVMDPKMHTTEDLYKIRSLFDGEIDIQEKQMKKLEKFLKIVRMSNQQYIKEETMLPEQ